MKFLIFSLVLTFIISVSAVTPVEFEERNEHFHDFIGNIINSTINNILKNFTDPTLIPDISLSFNETGSLEGGLNASDITLSGIKKLVATNITTNLGKLSLNMTIKLPKVTVSFDYWLDVLLGDLLPLYGKGLNNIQISGINLDIGGKLNVTKGVKVQLSSVLLTLSSATFNLNGLLNNAEFSALVNTALNDNFVPIVNNNNRLLSSILASIIEGIINGATGGNFKEVDSYNYNDLNNENFADIIDLF